MLEITRVYLNGTDQLRIDTIVMQRKDSSSTIGVAKAVFERKISTMLLYASPSREVDSIQIFGNFNTVEDDSGNFTWVSWSSPECTCYMDDLPVVGDTV